MLRFVDIVSKVFHVFVYHNAELPYRLKSARHCVGLWNHHFRRYNDIRFQKKGNDCCMHILTHAVVEFHQ